MFTLIFRFCSTVPKGEANARWWYSEEHKFLFCIQYKVYVCILEYHSSFNIYSHHYQTGSTAMTRHFKNLLLGPLKQGNQGRDIKLEWKKRVMHAQNLFHFSTEQPPKQTLFGL